MLESFDFEKHFGVKCFVSEQDGLGGKLRSLPEDFVVEEQGEPKPGDGYTALRIRYRNWESHSLRLRIQRDLGLREGDITVAGTKDKRAVVTQWITVRRRTPPTLHIPDVEVLENRPCSSLLRAGEHDGNNFRIRIKQMEMEGEEAVQRARDIAAAIGTGWPNYFGIQRFGAFRPITHVVGKELVCSGAEKAVKIYLGSPGITTGQEKEARQMAEEGAAWQDVMEAMPRHLNFENIMLRHLCEREGDYEGALLRLPRPLLLLFVHSYQSYMFNRILSRRLEMGLPLDRPVE
ncbi:MAG: tRNA pseudouridine(13) synthase TruD, partial [Thermoplasmata archaeon]|nr:tRNA pseudouridine(13) synthase TruD [Thermoplasmata archaeon]